MKNVIALIAVAGIAGAATAQNFEIRLNGGAFNEGVVVAPGDTVEISVWVTGGQNITNFSAWSTIGFDLTVLNGDLSGFTTFTEQNNSVETMPNPSATATTGWNTAPDTWQQGRRPGAGTALGGALTHNAWRFAPSVNFLAATYSPTAIAGGVRILQDGSVGINGTQGNATLLPVFTSEFLNTQADVEFFRINYTPETIGDHTVSAATQGAFVFQNGNFAGAVTVLPQMLAGSEAVITVIPAPGAFALLGLGGLAAVRRRR